jgi:predicted transcriptional regulator
MTDDLILLTSDIVSAMVANNKVNSSELPGLIESVHTALVNTSKPSEPEAPAGPVGATTARKSVSNPAHIVSMIDGKPYQTLKRHITRNGYTVESYKEAFGLPRDYPMVAAGYSAARREISLKLGLGRKKVGAAVDAIEGVAETVIEAVEKPVKAAGKKLGIAAAKAAAAAHLTNGETPAPKKRGRPAKASSAAKAPAIVADEPKRTGWWAKKSAE